MKEFSGSCHCGAVHFEADIDLGADGIRKCNCSFCWKTGYRKVLIPYAALRIVHGDGEMRDYKATPSAWPAGDVNHYFCNGCGVPTLR